MTYFPEDDEVIDRIVRGVNNHSKSHGFQEEWELADKLEEIANSIDSEPFGDGGRSPEEVQVLRDSATAMRANFLGMKIALMHSELSEALERLREVGVQRVIDGDDHFIEELGDTVIRTMETAAILGKVSFGRNILAKIKRNQARPYRHGKAH